MAGPRFVESTLEPRGRARDESERAPVIVLAHHAALTRVGEVLPVGRINEISRLAPSLIGDDGLTGPIDDPFVSRQPISLRQLAAGGFELGNPGVDVSVGGAVVPAGGVHRIAAEDVARGVPIVWAAPRSPRSRRRGARQFPGSARAGSAGPARRATQHGPSQPRRIATAGNQARRGRGNRRRTVV